METVWTENVFDGASGWREWETQREEETEGTGQELCRGANGGTG